MGESAPRRVTLSREGGVLRLILSHPASRNSLSETMMTALEQALAEASADPGVRVIVIAARGAAFSSGHDLKESHERLPGDRSSGGGLPLQGLRARGGG